jgi:hypothetical protein
VTAPYFPRRMYMQFFTEFVAEQNKTDITEMMRRPDYRLM